MLLLLSRFSHVRLCATPETAAHQAPPSLGFSRQEHMKQKNKQKERNKQKSGESKAVFMDSTTNFLHDIWKSVNLSVTQFLHLQSLGSDSMSFLEVLSYF